MKTMTLLLGATLAVPLFTLQAQTTFNFATTLGSGSFTLNTNNLLATGDNGSAAGFRDILDSLTFNGITYTNLDFSVYNNSFVVGYRDGFQILVDKSPSSSAARLEIDVNGNSTTVAGISVADLVIALSGFEVLKSSPFTASVLYNNPNPPYNQMLGSVTSFVRATPVSISAARVQTNGFGFNIVGDLNATIVVEVCTNISNSGWTPILTNTLVTGSTLPFSDPTWTNFPARLYRVKVQ